LNDDFIVVLLSPGAQQNKFSVSSSFNFGVGGQGGEGGGEEAGVMDIV
jgi:hypothetical protein